jgi:phthalate 4,5-dioxygenase
LPGLWIQDAACQSGVSPIVDRTQENLCVSDAGIAVTRQFLLESVAAYRDTGTKPVPAKDPTASMVRAISMTLPADADWQEAGSEPMTARVGKDFGYTP